MGISLQILRLLSGKYLFIFILVATNVSVAFSQDSIPEWFIYSGKYPNLTLGFTTKLHTATSDVKCRYAIEKHSYIKGSVKNSSTSLNNEGSNYFLKNIWFEFNFVDSIEASSVLKLYSGFCTNVLMDEFIFAYSLDSLSSTREDNLIDINNIPKPEWADKTAWFKDGIFYGVGIYIGTYNFNDAWITSEDLALKNLLDFFQVNVRSKSLIVSDGDTELMSSEMILTFNHEIRNYRLLERWFDSETRMCYSLVKLKMNDIKIFN